MARVNVEERCFGEARLNQLARAMGWDVRTALGALVFLWHDSQEMQKDRGTKEELAIWSRVDDNQVSSYLAALVSAGYVKPTGQETYIIKGNEEQIISLDAYKKKGKKGGRATHEKWKKIKEQTNQGNDLRAGGVASRGRPLGSMQFNSIQLNAMQSNIRPSGGGLAPAARRPPVPVSVLIGTYIKAWQSRYGTKARPDVGGKSQGILRRLASHHTQDQLCIMLQAYCQMEDEWFKTKTHDLATFEQNFNKVALALDKGRSNPTERTWQDAVKEEEERERRRVQCADGPPQDAMAE